MRRLAVCREVRAWQSLCRPHPLMPGNAHVLKNSFARPSRHRWLVLLAVIGMAAVGVFNYQKLPIDAVPDITNVRYRSIPRRQDIHRWRPSNG